MTLVGNETCIETAYFSLNIIITLTKLCLGPKLWYCQGPYVFLFDKLCFGPELWYRPGPYSWFHLFETYSSPRSRSIKMERDNKAFFSNAYNWQTQLVLNARNVILL